MTRDLVRRPRTVVAARSERELQQARADEGAVAQQLLLAAVAPATLRAYASDQKMFTAWCAEADRTPLPATAGTVVLYIAAMAAGTGPPDAGGVRRPRRASSISRHVAAIDFWHRKAKLPSPCDAEEVRDALRGARRRLGVAPVKKSPSLDVDIQRMVAAMPEDAARARDRALLLLGFAGAFRRSELVAIDIERLTLSASGLVVRLPRSKTDQIGAGRSVAVSRELASPCCPVEAVEQLLKLLPPTGPLFRSLSRRDEGQRLEAGWVARVVKTCAARIGADPRRLAGHSLRRGFVTSAHRAGRSMQAMQKVTGHKKFDTLAGYIDDEVDWSSAAGRGLLGGK